MRLLQSGTDIRTVQELVGQAKLTAPQVDPHVASLSDYSGPSPLGWRVELATPDPRTAPGELATPALNR